MASWDSIPASRARLSAPADGDLRRLRRTRRRPGRQDRSTNSSASASATTRSCSTSSATTARAPRASSGTISELLAQNNIPNTIEQQLAALERARWPRRARRPQDGQHVSRRLGLGRRHAVPAHQARRLAFRRHAQSDGDLVAEAHQARQDAARRSSTTSTTSRRRSTRSSASSRRRWSTASRRTRSTASAWPTPLPTPKRRAASARSTSTTTAAAASTTTAGTPARSARSSRGTRPGSARTRQGLGREQGCLGALRPAQRLLAGRRSRSEEPEAARADEGAVPEGGEGQQGVPDRRRQLAAPASRGPRQDALHELAVRRDDHPHAGVHRAGPRPREQPRRRSTPSSARTPRACSTRSAAPPAGSTLYMDKGDLVYEYNMMIIERYTRAIEGARSRPASTGSKSTRRSRSPAHRPRSCSRSTARRWPAPPSSAPCRRPSPRARRFDVGVDLGSPVSLDYFDRRPFKFDGKINSVNVELK